MVNQEQVIMLCKRRGVELWNRWRVENPDVEVDLSNIDLEDVELNTSPLTEQ